MAVKNLNKPGLAAGVLAVVNVDVVARTGNVTAKETEVSVKASKKVPAASASKMVVTGMDRAKIRARARIKTETGGLPIKIVHKIITRRPAPLQKTANRSRQAAREVIPGVTDLVVSDLVLIPDRVTVLSKKTAM